MRSCPDTEIDPKSLYANDNAEAKSNSGMAFLIRRPVESLHSHTVKLYRVSRAFGNLHFLRRLTQSSVSINMSRESFRRARCESCTTRAVQKTPTIVSAFDAERDVLAV